MVLPSSIITPEAQLRILSMTNCRLYVRPESMATVIDEIVRSQPNVQTITAPQLHELLQDTPAKPFLYTKSWEDVKDSPWLVFHSSGTTGKSQCHVWKLPRKLSMCQVFRSPSHILTE